MRHHQNPNLLHDLDQSSHRARRPGRIRTAAPLARQNSPFGLSEQKQRSVKSRAYETPAEPARTQSVCQLGTEAARSGRGRCTCGTRESL